MNKSAVLLVLFLLGNHSFFALSQTGDTNVKPISIDTLKLPQILQVEVQSMFTSEKALENIADGHIKLILGSGWTGGPTFFPRDDKFEKKYGLTYHSLGCIRMPNDDYEGYNQIIFDYLDRKFGKSWRSEVKKEVIGLPENYGYAVINSTVEPGADLNPHSAGNTLSQKNKEESEEEYSCLQPVVGLFFVIIQIGGVIFLIYYLIRHKKKNSKS